MVHKGIHSKYEEMWAAKKSWTEKEFFPTSTAFPLTFKSCYFLRHSFSYPGLLVMFIESVHLKIVKL